MKKNIIIAIFLLIGVLFFGCNISTTPIEQNNTEDNKGSEDDKDTEDNKDSEDDKDTEDNKDSEDDKGTEDDKDSDDNKGTEDDKGTDDNKGEGEDSNLPVLETVKKALFSVSGEVDFNDTVVITCPTEGATIFYTMDGSEPTSASSFYVNPIIITKACTIKAYAFKEGMNPSEVETKDYTIKTYTINFMTEHGTKPELLLKHKGEKIKFPELTADYYVLQKWCLDGKYYSIGEEFEVGTSDLTFTANWIPVSGSIKITAQDGNDFVITKTENNESVTLTAENGYSDFKWYLDGSDTVVSNESTYTFTPSKGVTMVFVTAKKGGVIYSATYYIEK